MGRGRIGRNRRAAGPIAALALASGLACLADAGASAALLPVRDLPPATHASAAPRVAPPSARGTALLEEGFEGVDFPPSGWIVYGNPAVPDSGTWNATSDPAAVHTGTGAALVEWQSARTQDEKLQTARIDAGAVAPADLVLGFWYRTDPFWAPFGDLLVQASADSVTWATAWRLSLAGESNGWEWRDATIDLGAYAGGDLWIRFRYFGRDGADLALDDVRLGPAAPPLPPPNDDCAGAAVPATTIGPAAGPFAVSSDNRAAIADYPLPDAATSCTGATCAGRDVVWRVRVPAGHRLVATMDTAGDWDDTLFLLTDCGDPVGSCVAGDRRIPDGSTVVWDNPDVVERTLWLVASAWSAGAGPFTVTGTIEPGVAVRAATWGRTKARWRPEAGR